MFRVHIDSQKFRNTFGHLRLSVKINGVYAMVVMLLFSISNYFIIVHTKNIMRDNARNSYREVTVLFARLNSQPIERASYFLLESNTTEIIKRPSVLYAEILDPGYLRLAPMSLEPTDVDSRESITITEPIFDEERAQRIVGYARIQFSMESTNREIRKNILLIIGLSLLILFITIIVINRLLAGIVKKPVTHLLSSVNKIAAGDLNHNVIVESSDELGELAACVNEMKTRLKDTLALTNNIMESMPSIMISLDDEGRVMRWNASAERHTKIVESDAVGKSLWDIIPGLGKFEPYTHYVSDTLKPITFPKENLSINVDKIFSVSVYPLKESEHKGVVIRIDDVTDLEIMDRQLRQAQKMEMIGTLAGGLAHDFNNVLGGITGTVSILTFKINKGQPVSQETLKESLTTIEDSAQRAADMVKQLLTLSHKHDLEFAPVDLNMTMKHIQKICMNTFDKCIELSFNYYPSNAMVYADPTQLEQVLLNLCVNGYHAMTLMRAEGELGNGRLTVSLGKIITDSIFIKTHPEAAEGTYWVLSVNDTGVGMSTKVVSKIFDPFFTTKEKGKGTGLGLAMAYNIIKQHHGFIDVYSEINLGSTFNVYFPVVETVKPSSQQKANSHIKKQTGMVLIIDDEATMRHVAHEMLVECGYKTISASNGEEGLQIYKIKQQEVDIVLLDMIMPKMSGEEVFEEITKINPEVRVILTSGFKKDDKVERIMKKGIRYFLQKPYTIQRISSVVYAAINNIDYTESD